MFCTGCGAGLPESARFCRACGREVRARATSPPAATTAPRQAGRLARLFRSAKRPRFWMEALGFIVLAYVAYAGLNDFLRPTSAYGPAGADQLDLMVAPGVSVEILPSARSLADVRFETFDVSPSGAVLVSKGSRVFDMASGEEVFASGESVRSFAFVGAALAVIDTRGKLGFFDGGRVRVVGDSQVPSARLAASSDRTRLFVYQDGHNDGRQLPALVSMREGSAPEVLTGSYGPINAVGGDALQTFFSGEHALFQVITPGRPSLLFVLPDAAQSITGIGVAGTAVYFATGNAVYVLEDGIAVPLVIGLGGGVRILSGALYVLDAKQGRVYRIVVAKASTP
jgi:hypothetical protein